MILVDTCVWIDFLRKKQTPQTQLLETLIKTQAAEIVTNHIIYFELLRGIERDLERKRIQKYLNEFEFYDHSIHDFDNLVTLYLKCRSRGFTLPRLGDWLILKSVLDHNLGLLTSDQDFYKLNKIQPFALVGI